MRFQDAEEFVAGVTLKPGLMSAFFQFDEVEIPHNRRERNADSVRRMRIVIAMNRGDRTFYPPARFQQFAAAAELSAFRPDFGINIRAKINVRLVRQLVKGVSTGKQRAETLETRSFVGYCRIFQNF